MLFAFTTDDKLPLLNNQSYHCIKYIFADYSTQCNFDNNQQNSTCNPELILEKHALVIGENFNLEASSSTMHVNCLISGSSQRTDSLLEIFNKTIIKEQTKYSYHAYVIKSLKKDLQIFFF